MRASTQVLHHIFESSSPYIDSAVWIYIVR
jgi:hypothetical protein